MEDLYLSSEGRFKATGKPCLSSTNTALPLLVIHLSGRQDRLQITGMDSKQKRRYHSEAYMTITVLKASSDGGSDRFE